jgi:hypothetical protein
MNLPNSVEFSQVAQVNGKSIPIYGKNVVLRYKDDALRAITADVVPMENLQVRGNPEAFGDGEAKKIVSERLGVASSVVSDPSLRLLLADDNPNAARVVVEVKVRMGGSRKDIHVLIDSETKQIVKVE